MMDYASEVKRRSFMHETNPSIHGPMKGWIDLGPSSPYRAWNDEEVDDEDTVRRTKSRDGGPQSGE